MTETIDPATLDAYVVITITILALVTSIFLSGIATLMNKQTAIKGVVRVVLSTLFVFCLSFGWMVYDIAKNKNN
jgi:uncharacterized membrane protein YsdA (DUF1294 family)